jgi:pimeloyl-ACP methyl ester carboxylesterase
MNKKSSILYLRFRMLIPLTLVVGTIGSLDGIGLDLTGPAFAQSQQPRTNFTSVEQQLPTKGNSFKIDNVTFSHHTIPLNGIQLHYVMGGQGDPVVLLHGWPETWYEWRHVMPALAKNYTVIAPDLRGHGDSSKPPTGYDGKTLAEDIYQLVTKLGYKSIFLVGHDVGVLAAYPYAAEHPSEVKKLVVMESPIPGFLPPPTPGMAPVWHLTFHQAPDVPEMLTDGKEREYLSWFYQNEAYNPAAITEDAINEYVSKYSAPGGMRAGFEAYRAVPQDVIQNQNYSKTNLTMPVLAIGAGYSPILGGNVTMPAIIYGMKQLANDVTDVVVPNSGHWIPEEQPVFLGKLLNNFFSSNSTTSSG